jgi:hypothetical protein
MGTDKWLYSAMAGAAAFLSNPGWADPGPRITCPPGAGGRAPAPKVGDRRKKRKEQKKARRNNRK